MGHLVCKGFSLAFLLLLVLEGDERKYEADVKRADSGYGGELSIPETPKVKRRLEEIVEGSSKHWSVVAASAKHWREVAKQRRMQRKGSPLRSPKRPPVTDDMVCEEF